MQPDSSYAQRLAYADPPYLGCCRLYGHDHRGVPNRRTAMHDEVGCWDDVRTHWKLIDRLFEDYPDGWAMSCSSPSLVSILTYDLRDRVRIGAWVKPFASFKPGVNPGYCWEPVLFAGGRKRTDKSEDTVRDYLAQSITLRKGLTGAKPPAFNRWILDLLGYREGDEMVDVFPGTGSMGHALAQGRLAV